VRASSNTKPTTGSLLLRRYSRQMHKAYLSAMQIRDICCERGDCLLSRQHRDRYLTQILQRTLYAELEVCITYKMSP